MWLCVIVQATNSRAKLGLPPRSLTDGSRLSLSVFLEESKA